MAAGNSAYVLAYTSPSVIAVSIALMETVTLAISHLQHLLHEYTLLLTSLPPSPVLNSKGCTGQTCIERERETEKDRQTEREEERERERGRKGEGSGSKEREREREVNIHKCTARGPCYSEVVRPGRFAV